MIVEIQSSMECNWNALEKLKATANIENKYNQNFYYTYEFIVFVTIFLYEDNEDDMLQCAI